MLTTEFQEHGLLFWPLEVTYVWDSVGQESVHWSKLIKSTGKDQITYLYANTFCYCASMMVIALVPMMYGSVCNNQKQQ